MNFLTKERKREIEAQAAQAAREGLTFAEACPWPVKSEEARHWVAVWILSRGKTA